MIQIAVSGITGRMGQTIAKAVFADKQTTLSVALARSGCKQLKWYVTKLGIPTEQSVKITDILKSDTNFDILIDFTLPAITNTYVQACLDFLKPIVIGTTRLSQQQQDTLQKAARYIPILYAPNMSLGMNLCFQLVKQCANSIDLNWHIAVSEVHHYHKKDVPSGSALQLANVITENSAFPHESIQFNSIRAGDVTGDHTVLFTHEGERIEITHRTSSRIAFAKGAIIAAKWLLNKNPGFYTMQDIIHSKKYNNC